MPIFCPNFSGQKCSDGLQGCRRDMCVCVCVCVVVCVEILMNGCCGVSQMEDDDEVERDGN